MLSRGFAIAGAFALGTLCGCGQKGPLYLPEKTGTVITRPTQTPAPATPESTPAPAPNPTTEDSNTQEEGQQPK